jgi:hypothetical protein
MVRLIPYTPLRVAEHWSWSTNILTLYSGLESRIANRTRPRQTWQIDFAVDLERDRRALRLLLWQHPADAWQLPLRQESAAAKAAVTGASIVVNATLLDWALTNQRVVVQGPDPDDYFLATITGTSGGTSSRTLTLSAGPSGGSYPKGSTRIMPYVDVLLDDGATGARAAPSGTLDEDEEDVGAGVWRFSGVTTTPIPFTGTGGNTTTFDGIPVLTMRPIVEGDPEEQTQAAIRRYDLGNVVVQQTALTDPGIGRAHRFFAEGDQERQDWKAFQLQVLGRQIAFLIATWENDVDVHTQPGPGDTTLLLDRAPGFGAWFTSASHHWLQLEHADETIEYAKVTSVVDNGDGTETAHLSAGLSGTAIAKVSMMELCRAADDDLTLEYQTNGWEANLRAVVVQR